MSNASEEIVDPVGHSFAAGDESALEAAYRAHGSLVFSYCRRSLPDDRAADVTQEVFVSAWKARARFDPKRGTLQAWLVGIAKNRIIDNVRSEQRHAGRRADLPDDDVPVESEIERTADRMLAAQALEALPDRQRKLVELAYLDGLSHAEIADRTGTPLGTVKSNIRRGLERIRRNLEGER